MAIFGLATILIGLVDGQDPCDPVDDPTCAMAWPPGHHGIGPSYWAIRSPHADIYMKWFTLELPKKGVLDGSAIALNPSLENSVCYTALRKIFPVPYSLEIINQNISDILDTGSAAVTPRAYQVLAVDYSWSACRQGISQWCITPSYFNASSSKSSGVAPVIYDYGDNVMVECMYMRLG